MPTALWAFIIMGCNHLYYSLPCHLISTFLGLHLILSTTIWHSICWINVGRISQKEESNILPSNWRELPISYNSNLQTVWTVRQILSCINFSSHQNYPIEISLKSEWHRIMDNSITSQVQASSSILQVTNTSHNKENLYEKVMLYYMGGKLCQTTYLVIIYISYWDCFRHVCWFGTAV